MTNALTRTDRRVCESIMELLIPHRRTPEPDSPTDPDSYPVQLRQLAGLVAEGEPIVFTLPGFPCKSPNPDKVLGRLPDEGERLALRFLARLCADVEQVYPPGARLTICSDGHIFGDVVGVADADVDAYSDELKAMIKTVSQVDLVRSLWCD